MIMTMLMPMMPMIVVGCWLFEEDYFIDNENNDDD